MVKVQTLKGFRDFLPEEKRQRDFVAGKIKETFELFGFEPLETPTLEYAELLLGKYGEEADKLVYTFEDRGERKVGLRYDQTVPTARVLAQYQSQLPRFFRRYQMQNVFRAEKPQRGRYREFAQCDIDIFGTKSEIADAEIIACTYSAYRALGFTNIKIAINDRAILFETLGPFTTNKLNIYSLIRTLDKLDKLPVEEVKQELMAKGISNPEEVFAAFGKSRLNKNLAKIWNISENLGVPSEALGFMPNLARGLDYYTGMIFEVRLGAEGSEIFLPGSVGGGGRYDNLIKDLSGVDIPAVGMAFGFDRTVEAAKELGLINQIASSVKVLIIIFSEEYLSQALEVANMLRKNNISCEIYPEIEPIGKQIKYADKNGIPYVVIIGEEEVQNNNFSLKNMKSGENSLLSFEELVQSIKA